MTAVVSAVVSPLTAVDDLRLPGEAEARALGDRCPACETTAPAVAVLDWDRDRDRGQRLAVYRDQCGERSIAHWPAARGTCGHCPASVEGYAARQAFTRGERCCRRCTHDPDPRP